jgi:hypothetical protein
LLRQPDQRRLIFAPDAAHAPHKGDIVVFTFSHLGVVEGPAPARSNHRRRHERTGEAAKGQPAGESIGLSLRFGASFVCPLHATAAQSTEELSGLAVMSTP